MTFLLQYFFEQKCLTRRQIYNWYSNKDTDVYQGFDGAKQMTTPFIQSLWTNSTGKIIYYGRLFSIIKYYFRY